MALSNNTSKINNILETINNLPDAPSGNKNITATTATQTGIDVADYATVSVEPTPSETKSVTTNGDVTPSSGKLLSKITVNVPTGTARSSSDLTVSGATVTVPAGLYSSQASKSVSSMTLPTSLATSASGTNKMTVSRQTATRYINIPQGYNSTAAYYTISPVADGSVTVGTPTINTSTGVVTGTASVSAGYVSGTPTSKTLSLTTQAAKTVTPSASSQTAVAAQRYTTGAVTVAAVPSETKTVDLSMTSGNQTVSASSGKWMTSVTVNKPATLLPENIKKDVNIGGVVGTMESGGGKGGDYNIVQTIDGDNCSLAITDANTFTVIPKTITANGTYTAAADNADGFSQVTVNVSGGGGELEKFISEQPTTAIFPTVSQIRDYAFYNCISLTTVSFPVCTSIGSYAFASCASLTTVSLPACTTIGNYAFASCSSLTTVSFPACTTIGNYVFGYCLSLTTVSLPACTSIGNNAFLRCYKLLSLYLTGSSYVTLSASNAFSSTPIGGYTTSTGGVYGSIYVPASMLNSYKTRTNWSYFAARFVGV